jgi:hypothetical protein
MRPACLLLILLGALAASEPPVNFSLQIRPILSEKCFSCHGPEATHREAHLRFDDEESAKGARKHGPAIVPGQPDTSEAWRRIMTSDADDVMPPLKTHRTLDAAQKALIKRWISEGAPWGRHWAFEPLQTAGAPANTSAAIDAFVAQGLREHGLTAGQPADPRTLARRLSLDLIGLPATPERADAFAQAWAAGAGAATATASYVDELLASPGYGEHWARVWLDLARFADTKGYEKDVGRQMWLYRDWVIQALNADMPFDRFTIEQLAGDLLPEATKQQRTATAFNRNTMTNDEGGIDKEEYRVMAVRDRVDTTGQVWLGLSVGCAKCHSHKYDPISQADYYRLFAIFNQTADANTDTPLLSLASPEQDGKRQGLEAAVAAAKAALDELRKGDATAARRDSPAAEDSPAIAAAKKALQAAKDQLSGFVGSIPSVLVMQELAASKRRTTRIHERGNFLSPGAEVTAAVLPLPGFPTISADQPADRLALARWLVDPGNPLTPRVMANRVWARLFGTGLVETEEDFGALGALPSHPALLDRLALSLRDEGAWSLKRLMRTIVLSRTYQQSAHVDAHGLEIDPANRWLSRAGRLRLTAEQVRDQTLAVAGLLCPTIGGPSVMPPQPDGLWHSTYNGSNWINATDADRYRRGLYTYWKRTTPYPSMTAFDAGSREVCQVRRIHTDTPLQALVTLNDPVFLEAAAGLAGRMVTAPGGPEARAERGLRLALVRTVRPDEVAAVVTAYQQAEMAFASHPADALALLTSAHAVRRAGAEVDQAAWTVAASVIINLDEFVTRN